jgi:hypothetical protein
MRRMILILMVAAMLVAMSATPAFAQDGSIFFVSTSGSGPAALPNPVILSQFDVTVSGEAEVGADFPRLGRGTVIIDGADG